MTIDYLRTTIGTGLFTFLINELFRSFFPNQYNKVVSIILYSIVYKYSQFTIIINRFIPVYKKRMNGFTKTKQLEDSIKNIKFIKNGVSVFECSQYHFELEKSHNLHDCTLILHFENSDDDIEQIKIIKSSEKSSEDNNKIDFNYKKSNVNFIYSEINIFKKHHSIMSQVIEETTVRIYFANDKYNFFIVDNVFDRIFLEYFLAHYYSIDIINSNYNLKIVDQHANIIELNDKDEIHIHENNYEIIKNVHIQKKKTFKELFNIF